MIAEVDFDLACAVALGLVECDGYVANLHQLTVLDRDLRPVGVFPNWLNPADQLHSATRDYLLARSTVQNAVPSGYGHKSAWKSAGTIKSREVAAAKANEIRSLARLLLHERGVLTRAKSLGYKLFL